MSKEVTPISQTKAAAIPHLDDPKHPGMHLVSKIALFSLSIFLVLFALLALAGNRVTLNFELDASARFSEQQLWLTIDEKQASAFEAGDEMSLQFEDGASTLATISEMGSPAKRKVTMSVMIKGDEFTSWQETGSTQDVKISADQSLKDFMISKLGLK